MSMPVNLLQKKQSKHRENAWCEDSLILGFVVLLQGMTIRPLVDLLHVKRKRESAPTVGEQIHIRVSEASVSTRLGLFCVLC